MANTFKSFGASAVGTTLTDVYTTPAATTSTVIGCSVANTTASPITVDVVLTKGATDYYIVKSADVSVGGTLVAIGGDQKVVCETGNIIKVKSSTTSSIDAIVSVLEIS